MGSLGRRVQVFQVAFLLGSVHCPHFYYSNPNNCFSTDNFHGGYYSSGVLRRLQNTGPFTCVRECLLRRSCHSVDYQSDGGRCELLYLLAEHRSITIPPDGQLHIEKTQMYPMSSMVNTLPCHDTKCGEYERCQVLFDNSTVCTTTECSPLNVSRLWTADVNSTLAVGEEVNFYCSNDPSLLMATVKCRQSGLWKITQRSLANTHQCNRIGFSGSTNPNQNSENPINDIKPHITILASNRSPNGPGNAAKCLKHQDAVYNNRSYGCYSFTNKAKSYKDATTYCQSMSPHSHLMFLDSAENVRDLKDVLPPYVSPMKFLWVEGLFIHENKTIDIWNGSIPVQKLRNLQAYANIDFTISGCLSFNALYEEIHVAKNCDDKYLFVCEIDINNYR